MKSIFQLFGSLVFVLLAQQATAACPSSLPAEKMIECIIAENDCKEANAIYLGIATTPETSPQDDTVVATTRTESQKDSQ